MATSRFSFPAPVVSPLGDKQNPDLPHFRKNTQKSRPLKQNFYSDDRGLVYEQHHKAGDVDAAEQMVESARQKHKMSTVEKERLLEEKEKKHSEGEKSWSESAKLELPYEVETDKQVLRAFAYFQESVPESDMERYRVRHVEIQCHVVSQTMEIHEHAEENSGLPQGKMLHRQRIPIDQKSQRFDLPSGTDSIVFTTKASLGIPKGEQEPLDRHATSSPSRKDHHVDSQKLQGGGGLFSTTGAGGTTKNSLKTSTGRNKKPGDEEVEEREYYDWRDLIVGNELLVYGKVLHIYDVDGFTRKWFAERGVEQPEAESTPSKGDSSRQHGVRPQPDPEFGFNKKMYPVKEYMEAQRGKFIRDPRQRKQFQENDGKVLRFDCVADERDEEGGEVSHLMLSYYLADDQVEVREVHYNNNGKDRFPKVLAKQPLPKDWKKAMEYGNNAAKERPDLFVRPEDLRVGEYINVYGRDLFIRACDKLTREWYSEKGNPQPPSAYRPAPPDDPPKREIPPHTGLGTEEDSLQSCYTVQPKPPKKDFSKWIAHDGEVYRFRCKFVNPSEPEKPRRFTINIYPADDSMSIYEPPIRNTGISGGKFLARRKHKKPNGELYAHIAPELVPGSTVEILGWQFQILDVDQFTREQLPSVDKEPLEAYYGVKKKMTAPEDQKKKDDEEAQEREQERTRKIEEDRKEAHRLYAESKRKAQEKAQRDYEEKRKPVEDSLVKIDEIVGEAEEEKPSMAASLRSLRDELARAPSVAGMLRILKERKRGATAAGRDREVRTIANIEEYLRSDSGEEESKTESKGSPSAPRNKPPAMYRTVNFDYGQDLEE